MVVVVTALVPIPDHPRSFKEYKRLGQQLLACDIPVMMIDGDLDMCWLARYLRWRGRDCYHSLGDNPQKNTLAYHVVQAQKTDWLHEASLFMPQTTVFVWIDYGIFHVLGVTRQVIESFVWRARNERVIAIPGCWDKQVAHDDAYPNWRFCGGVMVVPREYIVPLDHAVKREYLRRLADYNQVTWEVNVLASVEQCHPELPIWWFKADHNASLFTNYRSTEDADGQQTQELRGIQGRFS
jgi:hypothetical protein